MQTQSIPRIRKDVLTFMPLTCTWSRELMENVKKTCLSKSPLKGWIPIKIHIVDNPDLEEIFEDRKAAMRKMGRTEEELKEELCFMAESWQSVVSMCKYGVRCVEKKTNILGDTRAGIHLNRHYDMLLRFMTFRNFISARCIVVFKVVPGRVKKVMPRFKGRTLMHPSKHYDAHVSMIEPDPTISVCEGLANNFIYIYQLDDESKIPYQHPRQAVPYAVIQLRQPYRMTVGRPFTSFRDRFLAKMRNKESSESHKSSISRRKDDSTRSPSKHERHRRRSGHSNASDSDESSSRRRKRSRTPKEVRKRSKTPQRRSSDTEISISNNAVETKVESDQSNIQTKLQKIEEEIKLRQSKLTELRHIKISQDSEKIKDDKDLEDDYKNTDIAVLQSNTVESSEQGLVQTSNTQDLNDNFSPKITSVYSTSGIKDFEMNDTFSSQYRELSSGASTPTLDEPGDQLSEHVDKFVAPFINKDIPKQSRKLIVQNEDRYKLQGGVDCDKTLQNEVGCLSEKGNTQHEKEGEKVSLKFETEMCLKEKLNDSHTQAFQTTNTIISTEVAQKTDLEKTQENMEAISVAKIPERTLKTLKQEISSKDQHIAQQTSHTEKDLDIKQLFREAIYQMDPSDLYELLTQKLAGGDDDEPISESVTEVQDKTKETTYHKESEQSNDEMILDLSCKPVNKEAITNVENKVLTDVSDKVSDIQETKVGESNHPSEAPNLQSDSSYDQGSLGTNNSNLMVLDNLEILASVASELLPAKSNSIGLCNENPGKITLKTNKGKRKVMPGKTGSVNRRTTFSSSDKETEEQEYIFDAETFSPNGNRMNSRLNDTEHVIGKGPSVKTKLKSPLPIDTTNKTSTQSVNTKLANSCKIPTAKSTAKTDCKTGSVKNRPKDQEIHHVNVQNYSGDSQVKQVLASTKRNTANSVAAALAATEQPDLVFQNLTSTGSQQGHKRTAKQNNIATNKDQKVPNQNNESSDQSTTTIQRVLRSGKVLHPTIETRPPSRGNLFEKFSTDTSCKSDEKNDSISSKTTTVATQNLQTIKEVQNTTIQTVLNIANATIIKQEQDSTEFMQDSISLSPFVSEVKDRTNEIQTVNKQSTNNQNELTRKTTTIDNSKICTENKDNSSSSCQNTSTKTYKADDMLPVQKEPTTTNQNIETAANVEQSAVYTENIDDPSSSLEAISDGTHKAGEMATDNNKPTTDQNVVNNEITTPLKQPTVYTEKSSDSQIFSAPVPNKIKTASEQHTSYKNVRKTLLPTPTTIIKQEPSSSELSPLSIVIPPTSKVYKRSDSIDKVPKTPHVLDESIVDLMDKQVTENMKQSDITLNKLPVVVKTEPLSPLEDCVSATLKSGGQDNAAKSGKLLLAMSIKKEPVSPSKESFVTATEKSTKSTNSLNTVTCKQVDSSHKENPSDKTEGPSQISTEINKTLKDLEQVIGIFSKKVRKNSGDNDLNSSCGVEPKAKLSLNKSNENKSDSTIIDCKTVTANNKDNASVPARNGNLPERVDVPPLSGKTSLKSNESKQTSSDVMQIEVITGVNPVKRSPVRNKVSQAITLTTPSKSRNVKQGIGSSNKGKINTHMSAKRSMNANKSGIQTKSHGDDNVRTTRVLQSVVNECNSSGKTISKRIKKEPVTEDEYYGTSQSISVKRPSKKQSDGTKTKQSEKRRFPESTHSSYSQSKSVEKKVGNKTQIMQSSYWKKRPLDQMENSRSKFVNPLEAIRTEYSSTNYKDEHKRSHRNDDSFFRKGNDSKNGDGQRSSSSVSSHSSSIESPTRDFSKRSRHVPSHSDRNYSRYTNTSPLKYQSSGSGSYYVKSKWDSNENSRGSCQDRNPINTYTLESGQQGSYAKSYSPLLPTPYQYIPDNQNYQNINTINYQNISSRDDRSSICTTNSLLTSNYNELGRGNNYSTFDTERNNQTSAYSNSSYSREYVERERRNSLERQYNSNYKRTRSNSNEGIDKYDRKRHRSDSRDRKGSRLSERSRDRSDSRDRDRFRLKRKHSGSRGRDRSSSSEYNRSRTKAGLYETTDKKFDSYRPLPSAQHTYLPSDNGNRGQIMNDLTSQDPVDADITNTLSKAMSTLLKKIIYDDKAQDNTKEGRMADMVLDMVKARVSVGQNQNQQQLPQSFDTNRETKIRSTGMKNTYDNRTSSEQRPRSSSTLTSTQTSRHESENNTRSRHSNARSSSSSNSNRPSYSSTHKTPPIFNSILIPKYNPNFQNSSFTGVRRRYNRPWSSGRFNSRKVINSRSSNFTGSTKDKYSKSESRSTRDKKSPSK